MKSRLAIFSLLVATTCAGLPLNSFCQQPFVVVPPTNAMFPDYGAGNVAATRLRRMPSRLFDFDRAALRDVLRFLADEAEMPFVGIPESDAANRRLVTFTMQASPFTALESVCRDNGVRLTYENGVWYMRTVDEERERRLREEEENQLVGIVYRLKYDPVDRIDFRNSGSAAGGGGVSGTSGSSAQSSASGSSNLSAPVLPLQNSQRVFKAKAPRIVNEIRIMLGLPPISYNEDGTVQGEQQTAGRTVESTVATATDGESSAPGRLNPTYVPPQTPQVIYNSDSNALWVVATRQQHKWVEEYLLSVDQPQALIAIEVKFFETVRDPGKQLGINWAGTFVDAQGNQTGLRVSATDIRAGAPGSLGSFQLGDGSADGTPPGDLDALTNFNGSGFTFNAPYSAVLSASQVAFAIQAFMQDRQTSIVQYPRVLTVNNREVAITSAQTTPFIGQQSTVTGATDSTTAGAQFIQTGTQVNVLPKVVGSEQIAMTVAITISAITGFKELNYGGGVQDQVPITSGRVYNASLQVDSGYTLAVGGLESVDDTENKNGIPLLRDIPGVGELFKSKTRARNKRNLIVFITPTVIFNPKATRGVGETPETTIPVRPDDPTPPAFTPDGQLVGGIDAVNGALAWFEMQIRLFKQINKENRTDKESIKKLRAVIATARMLVTDVSLMRESAPASRQNELIQREERAIGVLTELNKILAAAQDNVF
ncbi:MAG: hypothetical protein SFU53_15835 [Terrimicrobiaceae bacterium]|nr:hypothetical protein [Terrimicrobiaceae bacterium]